MGVDFFNIYGENFEWLNLFNVWLSSVAYKEIRSQSLLRITELKKMVLENVQTDLVNARSR